MSTAADYDRAVNRSRRDFATAVRVALNGDLDGLAALLDTYEPQEARTHAYMAAVYLAGSLATHPPLVQEVILGLIGQQPTSRSCPD